MGATNIDPTHHTANQAIKYPLTPPCRFLSEYAPTNAIRINVGERKELHEVHISNQAPVNEFSIASKCRNGKR